MTIKECYDRIGNYNDAISRLGSERLILKYLNKFQTDQSLDSLSVSLQEKDYQHAFVHIHNLKGLYLNLSMTKLEPEAAILCDALRSYEPVHDPWPLFLSVRENHLMAVKVVNQLLESQSESEGTQ